MRISDWSSDVCSSDLAEQAGHVVDVAVGQHHGMDRTVPHALARMKLAALEDLLAQVGRGVQQHPALAVGGDRYRGLAGRGRQRVAAPRPLRSLVVAVPLREADRKSTRMNPSHYCASRTP